MTTRWRWSPRRKCAPAAIPTQSAVCAVIGSLLVSPRIPSVPKNLRVIARALARLADPAPEAGLHRVKPSREEEQKRPADERDRARISKTAAEREERGLRRPVVEALTHQ